VNENDENEEIISSEETKTESEEVLKKEDTLTSSPYPGTTLEIIRVEDLHLGFKVFDTPGIPNLAHISTFMDDLKNASYLLQQKRVTPQKFFMTKNKTLWIGALAKLDFIRGDQIDVIVYVSNKISLHKASLINSNEMYVKNYGNILFPTYNKEVKNVEFDGYDIEIQCDHKGMGTQEIEIFGLGWIGFHNIMKKPAYAKFTLYVPKNVGFLLRDSLVKIDMTKEERLERRHVNLEHLK